MSLNGPMGDFSDSGDEVSGCPEKRFPVVVLEMGGIFLSDDL